MTLTEACKPRTFYSKLWYSDTTASLKEFQREAARRDDEEKQKQRQVYLDQLKDELKILQDASNKGVYELVRVVREKFPPKTTVKKFKETDKTELDKCEEMQDYDRNRVLGKQCERVDQFGVVCIVLRRFYEPVKIQAVWVLNTGVMIFLNFILRKYPCGY